MARFVKLSVVALLGGATLIPAGEDGGRPRPKGGEEAERLVQELGSPSFKAREAATSKLRALGEAVLPALRKATDSPDPETRRRCERLIGQIEADVVERRDRELVERVTAKWAREDVRQFLVRLVTEERFATPERLRDAWDLAEYAAARASQISGRHFSSPALDVATFPVTRRPSFDYVKRTVLIPGLAHYSHMSKCLVVSSRPLPGVTGIDNSVVLLAGNVGKCTAINNSIVLCFGDVGWVTGVRNSVLLTTGRFEGATGADDSFFEVGGIGRFTISKNNVYLNLKGIQATRSTDDRFPAVPGPLELFRRPDQKGQDQGKAGRKE